jgi:hypothetical protein
MAAAAGFRAFTGWAIAVVVDCDPTAPAVLERRRFQLQAPEMPAEVYHVAARLPGRSGDDLIAHALEASLAAATRAVAGLLSAFPRLRSAGLVVRHEPPAPPPPHARMAHTGWHASEGQLYRYTLMRAVEDAGLNLIAFPEPELDDAATTILGLPSSELQRALVTMGAPIGPPWTQREKSATLAGWLALAAGP